MRDFFNNLDDDFKLAVTATIFYGLLILFILSTLRSCVDDMSCMSVCGTMEGSPSTIDCIESCKD